MDYTSQAWLINVMTYSEPEQSPLYHAENENRYNRQELIRHYEEAYGVRLVVIFDAIFSQSINFFEDLVFDSDTSKDMHILLTTPGGDGEEALRIVRSAQARCNELTVIVPDKAKSAGTILALGAHHILLGPTSDLGPVDPQLVLDPTSNQLISAKDIIAAVDAAEIAIQERPDTYPLHVSLLSNVSAIVVQQARSALARSSELVREALRSNPGRSKEEVEQLARALQEPLIDSSSSHGAVFGIEEALSAGLPIIKASDNSEQWDLLWRLWMKYFVQQMRIYEGAYASQIIGPWKNVN